MNAFQKIRSVGAALTKRAANAVGSFTKAGRSTAGSKNEMMREQIPSAGVTPSAESMVSAREVLNQLSMVGSG